MQVTACTKDIYGVSPSIQVKFLDSYAYKVKGLLPIFVVFDFSAIRLHTKLFFASDLSHKEQWHREGGGIPS